MLRFKYVVASVIATVLLLVSVQSFAADPVAVMKKASQQMITGLKKNQSKLKSHPKIITSLVDKYIVPHMNVERITGSILGRRYWMSASKKQRKDLMAELQKIVVSNYAAAFSSFDDDKVYFYPVRGGVKGPSVKLRTVIVRRTGQRIPVNYYLSQVQNKWKVYDYTVENVSVIDSYRSQFMPILKSGGVNALIKRLRKHNGK